MLALVWACGGSMPRDHISVRVDNESYGAQRVRIYCDGYNIVTLHDLRLNQSTVRTISVSRCQMATYRVETINTAYSPPGPVLLNPGDTLIITIKNYLPLTHHSVRKEGT